MDYNYTRMYDVSDQFVWEKGSGRRPMIESGGCLEWRGGDVGARRGQPFLLHKVRQAHLRQSTLHVLVSIDYAYGQKNGCLPSFVRRLLV